MKPFDLLQRIDYVQDTIVSEVLTSQGENSITLIALDSGTEINTHNSNVNAAVYVIEGDVDFTVENDKFNLSTGEMLIIEKNTPHSLTADKQSKILLIKL